MKTNLLLAALVSAFVSVQAVAQTTTEDPNRAERRGRMAASTPEQRAERQTAQMKKQLTLTAEQETAVAAINLKYAQQAQKLMTNGDRDRETLKQARDVMQGKDGELKAVLSKEQYQQYETMRDEQRNRMREGRGPRNNR
ncbi:hypothetical protein [Fibrella forsythiae]|uniref:DUF4890 domain-containing protein n=1 Tax=Fibrella forsythiae TaxID=2817061 RepID=A0ABS3JAM1_9BACT|nr:hypothetical protein [Fibrella forsythiae]MBO0947044.1 hypothetical protein [Fibrella forsythiae]